MSEVPAELDALGRMLYPLSCVSVHEHAWMVLGYGVWGMERFDVMASTVHALVVLIIPTNITVALYNNYEAVRL